MEETPIEEQAYERRVRAAKVSGRAPGRGFLGCGLVLLCVVLLFLGMVMTCPSRAMHEETVGREVKTVMEHEMMASDNPYLALGGLFSPLLADLAVGRWLEVDNYLVASVGTVRYKGETRVVSLGIFNHVFTFDAEDVISRSKDAATSDNNLNH